MTNNIRWHQRLSSFQKALDKLQQAATLSNKRKLSDIKTQGLIKAFEFTCELAWNVMRDFFYYQGTAQITGSRDAIRESFQKGLVDDGDTWMEMIKSRNQTSHTYNEEIAIEIAKKIVDQYLSLFIDFGMQMEKLKHNKQNK